MNPGQMRYSIEIYDRGEKRDAHGYLNPEETLIHACRAKVGYGSNREVWEGYAAKVRNIVNFSIRPVDKGIRPGMWVKWKNEWHEIMAIQGGAYLGAAMVLKTAVKEAI